MLNCLPCRRHDVAIARALEPHRLIVHVRVVVVQPQVVANLVRHDVDRGEAAGGIRPPVLVLHPDLADDAAQAPLAHPCDRHPISKARQWILRRCWAVEECLISCFSSSSHY